MAPFQGSKEASARLGLTPQARVVPPFGLRRGSGCGPAAFRSEGVTYAAMPESTILLLSLLILIVAFLYSSVGHAGASGYLAAMALMGMAPQVMKPTSLALNILVAAITSIQFARSGHFHWRLFWPFAAASVPMAFLGGRIVLPGEYYRPLVGVVLWLSALRLVMATPKSGGEVRPPPVPVALGIGAALGLLSGLTGTGGGIFLSPLIVLCGWADPKKTGGVSAVFILVNSISGIAGLLSKVGTLPPAVPLWLVAAAAGGLSGSYLGSRKFDALTLRRLMAVVLAIAGAKLIFSRQPDKPPARPAAADHARVRFAHGCLTQGQAGAGVRLDAGDREGVRDRDRGAGGVGDADGAGCGEAAGGCG